MIRFVRGLLVLSVSLLASACDGDEPVKGMALESASRRVVHLRTLTQLLPNRPTHVAVDRLGQIFWCQENEAGQDVLFMIGDGGIPRATRLTTSNILAALEEGGDDAGSGGRGAGGSGGGGGGGGNIRDVAAGPGGVYFYFYGYKGNAPKACLGQYLPQSGRIRVLADTRALERASGMGRSMELARASIVPSGETVYFWLRHTDASAIFSFDPRTLGPLGPIELRVPFREIVAEHRPLPLARRECELSAAPGGALFLLDLTAALLWHVDRTGEATARLPLTGLPKLITPPVAAAGGDGDRLVLFAADSEKIGTELAQLARQDLPRIDYPALLDITKTGVTAITRDDFRAHAGFPVYALRLARLVPESPNSYVSFDAASGALMRVRVVEQE